MPVFETPSGATGIVLYECTSWMAFFFLVLHGLLVLYEKIDVQAILAIIAIVKNEINGSVRIYPPS